MRFSNGLIRYAKNTGYLVLEKIARIVITITVWAYVISYLGPEQFGIFSYALSFVFLFNILSELGLDSIVVRELVRGDIKQEQILGTAFFLKFAGSLFAAVLIFTATRIYSFDPAICLIVVVMSLRLVFQSLDNIDYYFQSRVLSKFAVYSQLLSLVVTAVLCLLFVSLKMPLIYFASVVVVETAVNAFGLGLFYTLNKQKIWRWQINLDIAKRLLKDSWPLIVSGLAIAVYMRLDQIMIKEMLGMAAVGYYSAAIRISEVFYFIPIVLASSLFPAIVNIKLKDETLYYDRLRALFAVLAWFAIGVSVVTTVIAYPVVNGLYGPAYRPAAGVLSLHIWASIFVFLGVARGMWAVNENLQTYTMVYTIVSAVVNIILNYILIRTSGIQGAAVAAVISQFVAAVLTNLFSAKTRKMFFLQLEALDLFKTLKKLNLSRRAL